MTSGTHTYLKDVLKITFFITATENMAVKNNKFKYISLKAFLKCFYSFLREKN